MWIFICFQQSNHGTLCNTKVSNSYISNTIKINLKIEEKQLTNTLSQKELIIENYSGIYKVKKWFNKNLA